MAIRLPLHEVHASLGARFIEADGYLLPQEYAGAAAEHAALRERAGVIDRSQRGKVEATGRDRVSFLQGMLTSDVKALAAGQGRRAAFLDVHGKVLSLLVVHSLADRLVLEMDRSLVAPTLAGLDRFLISERVELEDASDASGLLTVVGPAARAAVEKIAGQPLPDLAPWHHVRLEAEGEAVRVVRNDELGEEGYDLWLRPEALAPWWERAMAAGAQPVGQAAWEVCRVEAGRVRHGADVSASTLIMEAALDDVYSLTKGCYIGQEVVARVSLPRPRQPQARRLRVPGCADPGARCARCGWTARTWGGSPAPSSRPPSGAGSPSATCGASTGSRGPGSRSPVTARPSPRRSHRCPSTGARERMTAPSDRAPNRLARETSPYLLQHQFNPVDWYPWGDEALARAKAEDKPIMLSVGYSACHWCHVMERESFEDPATAAVMNEHFVNVKVDREERPDVDAIYMQAVQALTGHGGWPMTVFLTPEGVPFYGGTYFPPDERHGLPSFRRVLLSMAEVYREQRGRVQEAGRQMLEQLRQGERVRAGADLLTTELLHRAFQQLRAGADRQHGGLGGAPKFPQPMTLGLRPPLLAAHRHARCARRCSG